MDQIKLMQRLMATFLEELDERVRELNRELLTLEKQPSGAPGGPDRAELLKALFRTAHSLKGAARAVDVSMIESACHQLEELLTAIQKGQMEAGPDMFALLFSTADAIEEAGMRLREQKDLTGAPLAALLPQLQAAVAAAGPPISSSPRRQLRKSIAAADAPREPKTLSNKGGSGRGQMVPDEQLPMVAIMKAPQETPLVESSATASTLRVSSEKLDAFLARNGEMLVARRRVELRSEEVQSVRETVERWKAEWSVVEKTLGAILRQQESLDAEKSVAISLPDAGKALTIATANEPLQMPALPHRVVQALINAGNNIRRLDKDLERLSSTMSSDSRLLNQVGGFIDEEVRRVRMFPFEEACNGLERMVRDLAKTTGKEAELVIKGGSVELDRSVLEALKDPLRHLVRNSLDHGLENMEQRRAAGKSARGLITVAAALRGAQVHVQVTDDGRGLDLEALRVQAQKRKLPEPSDEKDLARLIFLPGLSTARIITDVSGRGVGLDVVKSQVESLHGSVDVSFVPGRGTQFTLAVPLTLTTLRALFLVAGGQTFAMVSTNVQQLLRVDRSHFRNIEGREMLPGNGPPLPVVSLAETLGLGAREPMKASEKMPALVVAVGDQRLVFLVDELLTEQEIVIKGLGARIRRARHVSGATILPTGKIALVLNTPNLLRSALNRVPARLPATEPEGNGAQVKKHILIAEDSVTTRTLEKSILEAAGYDVAVAVDGASAWQMLQEHGTDLVVSDVDMPRMDGFGLTEAIRGSKRFKDLPVVLVTARETEQDKARGVAVGANAYLVKSAFDQTSLLEAIAQLL